MATASEKWGRVYRSPGVQPWDSGTIPSDLLAIFDAELQRRPNVLVLVDYGCGSGKWLKASQSSCYRVGIDCVDRSPLVDPTAAHVISDELPLRPGTYGLLCVGVLHHYPSEGASAIIASVCDVVLSGVLLLGFFAPDDPAFGSGRRYLSESTGDWVHAHDSGEFSGMLSRKGWSTATSFRTAREMRASDVTALRRWQFLLATSDS